MATPLRDDHHYDADIATVWAMLSDRGYSLAKYDALGQTDVEVECGPDGDLYVVRSRRTVPAEVPGFAKKFVGDNTTVRQVDSWGPEIDGRREGTWTVDSAGAPVRARGSMVLEPRGPGCVVSFTGEVKASVPLVGGKLEGYVRDIALKTMRDEHAFGLDWLARG